jgi:hypothetical protein
VCRCVLCVCVCVFVCVVCVCVCVYYIATEEGQGMMSWERCSRVAHIGLSQVGVAW